jgi:hypothetical protein
LEVFLDGTRVGALRIETSDNYDWLEAISDSGGKAIELAPGVHSLELRYPAGQTASVQKVCLTNELSP